MKYHKSDTLHETIADAEAYQQERGDEMLLESHFIYAILSKPKRLMSMICDRLGVRSAMVEQAINDGRYGIREYSSVIEHKAAEEFLAESPAPLLKETHVFLTLCRESDFIEFLKASHIDPDEFVHECFSLTGRSEMIS